MTAPVTHLVVGPPRHGVVRFGVELVGALREIGVDASAERVAEVNALAADDDRATRLHLQFTDRIWGATPGGAAQAVVALCAAAEARGGSITVTLHDLPQPSDGVHHDRRRAAYRRVAEAATGVVVSSEHERALLSGCGARPRAVGVVPLPVTPARATAARPAGATRSVGVFGFVYPGKGHEEVLAALDGAAPDVALVALGEASAGHDDLVAQLTTHAAAAGRPFTVTGHLPDDEVDDALRRVTVAVAPHRHVSASGSLNSWITAGRRPLAPANRYTREFDARNPGVLHLYPDTESGLRDALHAALADPARTWLAPGTCCTPTRREAAAQYAALLDCWHR